MLSPQHAIHDEEVKSAASPIAHDPEVEALAQEAAEQAQQALAEKSNDNKYSTEASGGFKSRLHAQKVHFLKQFWKEWELLKFYAWSIIALIIATFFHSAFTKLAFWLYNEYQVYDDPLLNDLLFKLFGKLGDEYRPIVESITFTLIGTMVIFGVAPFLVQREYYAVHILHRYLLTTIITFVGRVISFITTILPSPANHCRGPPDPDYKPPQTVVQILFGLDVFNGCADLIYSGHTVFSLTVALMVAKYGHHRPFKFLLFALVLTNACMIIALQNHYTVDVWLALYVTPFVFLTVNTYIPDKKPASLVAMEEAERAANKHYRAKKEIPTEELEQLMNHLSVELLGHAKVSADIESVPEKQLLVRNASQSISEGQGSKNDSQNSEIAG